jgi:hypothetical protein
MSMTASGIGALVPYTDGIPTEVRQSFSKRWAILVNPSPGRTLNEVYSTIGQSLEIRANRIADFLGLGPLAVARKITSFFGTGEERHQQLNTLRNEIPVELIEYCSKLMGYTLPYVWLSFFSYEYLLRFHVSTESAKTQCQAFERIVALTTLFPGLRFLLLCSKCMVGVPVLKDHIAAVWDRPMGSLDSTWSFWRTLAATCLSETSIAVIVEQTPVQQLANCPEDSTGLSVIERLLIARGCE